MLTPAETGADGEEAEAPAPFPLGGGPEAGAPAVDGRGKRRLELAREALVPAGPPVKEAPVAGARAAPCATLAAATATVRGDSPATAPAGTAATGGAAWSAP